MRETEYEQTELSHPGDPPSFIILMQSLCQALQKRELGDSSWTQDTSVCLHSLS